MRSLCCFIVLWILDPLELFPHLIFSNIFVQGYVPTNCFLRDNNKRQSYLPKRYRTKESSLELKDFGQDELPNLFGINPVEATILFGTAYYVFGSEKLYEFAREAGRIFSTYFPIVRQAIEDIIYEFRDFLEEDRERALLQKAGIDISLLPRRTTNIIERLQKGIEVNVTKYLIRLVFLLILFFFLIYSFRLWEK